MSILLTAIKTGAKAAGEELARLADEAEAEALEAKRAALDRRQAALDARQEVRDLLTPTCAPLPDSSRRS